ncbi:MAG TPA: ParB/RepB/Spo0J family partition protein [Caulobacteraceae bacterium]|jgi:ParB family chromosome partitioning protein
MSEARSSRGLGRGLSALLGEVDLPAPEAAAVLAASATPAQADSEVPIELLRRNPEQPRRQFSETEIEELADSIREKGILQPLLVRPAPGAAGEFQIIAGERRWRAAQRAGLRTVPVLVRDLDDLEVLEVAIVENVQRADLNAMEEAQGYKALLERFGRTQEVVAKTVGKSRSHVANTMRLLSLPEEVQQHVAAGRLTAGHARAIATAPDPGALARRIVDEGLNVRQAEALMKERAPAPKPGKSTRRGRNADIQALEQDLADVLGLDVEIRDQDGKGELRLKYGNLEQLDDLFRRLTRATTGGF